MPQTFGAKHPAFAVLLNTRTKVMVVAVRGSKGKQDHLIDLDFQYDTLLPSSLSVLNTPISFPDLVSNPPLSLPTATSRESKMAAEEMEGKGEGEWQGNVHRGMLKCARFMLQTRGLRSMLALLPSEYKIRLVGHSLGAGIVALMTALLKADAAFTTYDIRAHAFGTPACVSQELSLKLQPFVTTVIHREDMVPRLSFSNLMRLRSHFNRPEEKEWCSRQIEMDYENFWTYVGWSADEKKQREMREAEDAQAAADAAASQSLAAGAVQATAAEAFAATSEGLPIHRANFCVKNLLGDLVVPGQVIHLREDAATGCYQVDKSRSYL